MALNDDIRNALYEDLAKVKRNVGFSGIEGDMINQQEDQNVNAMAQLVGGESQTDRWKRLNPNQQLPQNYMIGSSGQMRDLGASATPMQLYGRPAYLSPNGQDISVMLETGGTYNTTVAEQNAIKEQQRRNAELADLPRRMALAKLAKEEADVKGVQKPTFNAELGGYVYPPSAENPQGKFVAVAGMPSGSGASKATEDERKAAGWLNQASNAYQNMMTAIKEGGVDIAVPGAFEAILPEGLKGGVQSEPRQKFTQAASSLSEALLRAATGAGVNESEAKQKIQELTPTYFDKPGTREQKLAAIPMYLESLKARSGRATPQGYTMPSDGNQQQAQVPKTGEVRNGYVFLGGNPADENRWRKQ